MTLMQTVKLVSHLCIECYVSTCLIVLSQRAVIFYGIYSFANCGSKEQYNENGEFVIQEALISTGDAAQQKLGRTCTVKIQESNLQL